MQIQTKYLGEMDIQEENILTFPWGIYGFVDSKKFVVLEIPDNDHIRFLQDIDNSSIAFILITPWDFFEDYDMEITEEELAKIDIYADNKKEMTVCNIVTLGHTFRESTANLLAPIIINSSNKKGMQIILNETHYTTKHNLFKEGDA